jgi:hypothetical protein
METSASDTGLEADSPAVATLPSDDPLRGPDGKPMTIGVDYMGVLPKKELEEGGSFPPGTDFAKVFGAEIRAKCVAVHPGIEGPFRVSSSSLRGMEDALSEKGVPPGIRARIAEIIVRKGNAPKCEILHDERFLVSVSYPNPPKATDTEHIEDHIVDGTRPRFENGICPDWRNRA